MVISGSWNGGTVPYKAIFSGDIPLHRPYIGLIYGRYLQFRFLKWPLTLAAFQWSENDAGHENLISILAMALVLVSTVSTIQ